MVVIVGTIVRIDEKLAKQLKAFNKQLNKSSGYKFSFNDATRIYAETYGANGIILEKKKTRSKIPRRKTERLFKL